MTRETSIILISGNRQQDALMHAADMFESFKVLATIKNVILTWEEGKPIDFEKAIPIIVKAAEQAGDRVVACFLPESPVGAYLDTSVRVISDGHGFTILDKALMYYGYKAPVKQELDYSI